MGEEGGPSSPFLFLLPKLSRSPSKGGGGEGEDTMFARTERLLLRPGWTEDAPALARAIADRAIVCNLSTAPWPYTLRDAEAFLAQPRDPVLPSFLIFERTDGEPRLVGACGLGRRDSGSVELGYWIAREDWGRGFATEASRALIGIARTLGFCGLEASHFLDNPASARVFEKLGFEPVGITAPRLSVARGEEAPARLLRLRLTADSQRCSEREEALAA
jgi:RimJ/RimL family protein N-acetyltransferase